MGHELETTTVSAGSRSIKVTLGIQGQIKSFGLGQSLTVVVLSPLSVTCITKLTLAAPVALVLAYSVHVAAAQHVGDRFVDHRQDRGLRLHGDGEDRLPRQLRTAGPELRVTALSLEHA